MSLSETAGRSIKAALAIPARDKAQYVGDTVRQALAQTYPNIEFLFSDQGSKDGTFDVMERACRGYDGPGKVRILSCPDTTRKSMAGLIAHINWLHGQTDADVICMLSADDMIYPRYIERVVEAVEKGAKYIACAKHFRSDDGEIRMRSPYDWDDRFLTASDCTNNLVGGSTLGAWTTDFWRRWGPLTPFELVDVALPFYAGVEGGLYYVAEILASYVDRPDPENTGMEGRLKNAEREGNTSLSLQWTEATHYQLATNLDVMMDKVRASPIRPSEEDFTTLCHAILARAGAWAKARNTLNAAGIPPVGLP